jgi:hypothetical protein
MAQIPNLRCDGCGQTASPEHVARRLQRLEWSTRFRPVHIGTLLLGASSAQTDAGFLYSPTCAREGEARFALEAAGIDVQGKSAEAVLAEFQRGGFFLTHVLECPVEDGSAQSAAKLIAGHLPAAVARIRRSLRPKRVVAVSGLLAESMAALRGADLGGAVVLGDTQPFALEHGATEAARLREVLSRPASARLGAV